MAVNQRAVDLLAGSMKYKSRGMLDGPAVHKADDRVAAFALSYLDAFGWLRDELSAWKDISLQDIKLALGDLQASLGLKRTRTLTVQTVRAMEAPRCGCPDVARPHHKCSRELDRRRRAMQPRWKKKGLTYFIGDWLPPITKDDFAAVIADAFSSWAVHTRLRVERTTRVERADVFVNVGRGRHSNFDGPGGTLAWASLPLGDRQVQVRFDSEEAWTLDPCERGVCVGNVARHEVGHVLGLTHTDTPCSLMSPFYNAAVATPQPADVARLQAVYGKPG